MIKNNFTLTLTLLLINPFLYSSYSHAKNPCLDLPPVHNKIIAYQDRGNRCEGFYEASVAASSLDVVGLIHGILDYKLENDSSLLITTPRLKNRNIHIQAVGIPLKTYYRLDAWKSADKIFQWPLDIIKKMGLPLTHIGLFGQLVEEPDIYVPLVLSKPGINEPTKPIILTLRASVDVGPLHWRNGRLLGQQCHDLSQVDWNILEPSWGERFASGEAITLELSPRKGGICIETATHEAGSARWLKRLIKIRLEE